ncbi:hypothetical protein NC652_015228 [Populus alba x Populus x berolinensis]|nr:hypothetical protein NC652_015228 [Populus alba x Populus x berolinensis]
MTLMSSTVPVGALLIFPLVRYIVELSRNLTKLTESSKVSKMEMVAKLSCSCQVIVKHYKRTSFSLDEAAYLKSEVFSTQYHAMSCRHDSLIEFNQHKMESTEEPEALPPPPPEIPPNVVPVQLTTDSVPEETKKISKPKRSPIARRGVGSRGQKIQLLSNHFKVSISNTGGHFFHYCVSLSYEDGRPIDAKGIGRRLIDKVHETYGSDLAGKDFAYDGEKSLFTIGALPRNKMEFTVLLDSFSSNRNSGNGSPVGNGSPNETD